MKRKTKGGLQLKMTVYVTTAVLIASSIILLIIAGWVRKDYDVLMHNRISDDLTAITRVMEQRLLRIEDATHSLAVNATSILSAESNVDSLLYRNLKVMDGVRAVSFIFARDIVKCDSGYYERYAHYDDDGRILLDTYVNSADFSDDSDWVKCYQLGESFWGELETDYYGTYHIFCFFVPFADENGRRMGMAYSAVLESSLTSFVTEHKLRKDVDISIYKADGTMVVAPDDYILELSPKDMIIEESIIEHLGWKVILSADKAIISRNVRKSMLIMFMLFVLEFIIVYLCIKYTVRYVAKPFIEKERRTEKEKTVMENEMMLAAAAQKELIPHVFPPFPQRSEIEIAACLNPSHQVGGDLYDYFINGDRLYFCIGDVSGKGVQASMFMTATHYLFRSVAAESSVAQAAEHINNSLCTDNEKCRFVTFWMGCLDLCSGKLEYVNAGHDSPILIGNRGIETFPDSENAPLGVIENVELISGSRTLVPGDILFLYTDGITEAMNAAGHEFGKARLNEILVNTACTYASAVIENVLDRVIEHSSGTNQSDDITMLCLKFVMKQNGSEAV